MSNDSTPNFDAAGSNAPTFHTPDGEGAIICVDATEARLLRKQGYNCVTAAKVRREIDAILTSGADDAEALAIAAIGRMGGATDAADPAGWGFWEMYHRCYATGIKAAFKALPVIPTPFQDPEDVTEFPPHSPFVWCEGTTVLVAEDTVDLARAAHTYARFDCYRHHGRMDEPFSPQAGRVCLVTKDELRLLRVGNTEDLTVVFTFDPKNKGLAEQENAHWLPQLRALCGEKPDLAVVVAKYLVPCRTGQPFFLGLSRGAVAQNCFRNDPANDAAARAYYIQTNRKPVRVERTELVWEGGDDLRYLVRFGGLTVFQSLNKRRKVQLRSLGLVRSGTLAGAPVYELAANQATLCTWVASRTFEKPETSQRARNQRRVRCRRQVLPEYARGYIYNTQSPRRIEVTPSAARKSAAILRNMMIAEADEEGGVTTVHLKTLGEGGRYFLNSRASMRDGVVFGDQKRCKIRCPKWESADPQALVEWLAQEPHVVFSGQEPTGLIFAVVKVANGTADQQREAVNRWAEDVGTRFPHASGCPSWCPSSLIFDAETDVGALHHTNWRAESLRTDLYERYKTGGEYPQPLKIERRGTATAQERAKAYVDSLPESFDTEGSRNTQLSTAMLCIRDKIGLDGLISVMPKLLARSSLPDKEKAKMVRNKLMPRHTQPEKGNQEHGNG